MLPIVWLVGGSGKLGLAISEILQFSHNIVCLSRSQKKKNNDNYLHYPLDLANRSSLEKSLAHLNEHYFPRAIVFCQRYRPPKNNSEFDMSEAFDIEIFAPQKIIEQTSQRTSRGPLSVVIISSVNGYLINNRLPFWYHLLKVSQIHLMKYYSMSKQTAQFNINCIAAGTFLKGNPEIYPAEHRSFLDALQMANASRKICTTQDLASIVEFLISDKADCMNGQTITSDGGLTNKLQEELIQNYDQQKR